MPPSQKPFSDSLKIKDKNNITALQAITVIFSIFVFLGLLTLIIWVSLLVREPYGKYVGIILAYTLIGAIEIWQNSNFDWKLKGYENAKLFKIDAAYLWKTIGLLLLIAGLSVYLVNLFKLDFKWSGLPILLWLNFDRFLREKIEKKRAAN